jgi:hypothetical protein
MVLPLLTLETLPSLISGPADMAYEDLSYSQAERSPKHRRGIRELSDSPDFTASLLKL